MEFLISRLKENGMLRFPRVEEAFRAVPRIHFVPEELREEAYEDYPLPLGFGATISQPTTVAFMLEKLDVRLGQKVLDIGSGSGWTTALLAHLVGPKGRVIGLEIVPELVTLGQRNLAKYYFLIRANKQIVESAEIQQAEKGAVGLPRVAPFDRILVSASAEEFPRELMDQLKIGGRMVTPIRDSIWVVEKTADEKPTITKFHGFAFVPLV